MYFEKVSFEQWQRDCDKLCLDIDVAAAYDNIECPNSSTAFSAGHDFKMPLAFNIAADTKVTIPTGIRWVTETPEEKNMVLIICPRSGLGVKYGMRLVNTIGVIDADYFEANNEGHIMAIIKSDADFNLYIGDRFMQGLILPFIHCGEKINTTRTGGFGSTGN